MPRITKTLAMSLCALLVATAAAWAVEPLLQPGDPILGIDASKSGSWFPPAENPGNVADGNPGTKYLNFGQANSGLIVTPAGGPSILQSLMLTTANDSENRDPASYEIYGTNDPIASGNNSLGNLESWALISAGALSLPSTRLTAGPVVSFANGTAYSSYRIVFPTVKNVGSTANSMQVSEVSVFQSGDGSGPNVLAGGSFRGIDVDVLATSQSNYPGGENPTLTLDGNPGTKYLNFGRTDTGIIVTPQKGPSIVTGLQLATANDGPERDPMTFLLYGTNDAISSGDNSFGEAENWTLIASGDTGIAALAANRQTLGEMVTFANAMTFSSYKLVFPTLRLTNASGGLANPNSMQVGDIQFFGTVIPEPTTLALLAVGALAARSRRRSR